MKEKLRILMQNENLTATRLAEKLQIQPAAVSHILNGRNKPSYDLICKIAQAFPRVNLRWLLGDDEQMFDSSPVRQELDGLFGALGRVENETQPKCAISDIASTVASSSNVEQIIIVYADKSFEVLSPKQ